MLAEPARGRMSRGRTARSNLLRGGIIVVVGTKMSLIQKMPKTFEVSCDPKLDCATNIFIYHVVSAHPNFTRQMNALIRDLINPCKHTKFHEMNSRDSLYYQ